MRGLFVIMILIFVVSGVARGEDLWGDELALGDTSPINPKLVKEPAPRLGFIMSSGRMLVGPYKKIPEKLAVLPGSGDIAACKYERPLSKDDLPMLQKKWVMCDYMYENYYWYDCPQLRGRYKNLGYGFAVRNSVEDFKSVSFVKSDTPVIAATDALRKSAKMPDAKVRQVVYRFQGGAFVLGALFKKDVLWMSGIYQLDAHDKIITTLSLEEWKGEDVCADCGPLEIGAPIDFLFELSNVFVANGKWLLLQDFNTIEGRGMKLGTILGKESGNSYFQNYYVGSCVGPSVIGS